VTTPSKALPVADLRNSQLKKDGVEIFKLPHLAKMFPQFYQIPKRKTTQSGRIPESKNSGMSVAKPKTS